MTTDLINFKPRQVSIYRQMTEMAAFLARAYQKEVDQTFLDEVAHTAPRIVRWAQALRRADLQEGAGLLQQVSEQASRAPDREADLEWLAVEYAGLFLGASENSVDAIESVYLGEEHCLYEAPFFEVLEAYRSWDYAKPKGFAEPEDHIASELDFLAVQFGRAAVALEAGDTDESRRYASAACAFAREHLGRWAPEVVRRMAQATQEPFYLAVAHLTGGMVDLAQVSCE